MSASQSLEPSGVLNRLDSLLGEIGRREHRFSWLVGQLTENWIVLAAYYPGNRVVVLLSDDAETVGACEELVPRHGLFLLTLSSGDLAADATAMAATVRARLEIQGWERRPERPVQQISRPVSLGDVLRREPGPPRDEFAFEAAPRAPREAPAPVAAHGRSRRSSESEGIAVGIILVLAVGFELFLGGALVGLDAGQYVLGFGFLLDACARVLGMVVASQRGDLDAAWAAVIFGSPGIWNLEDSESSDLVPVARTTAILAGVALALGLLIWIV